MGNEVYANSMEVSCKAAAGKAVCAFPDVCFTPPLTPATPPGVPIPYPNTGMASDTTDGSKSVQVSGQEVMLKDKSCFKKSTGDEAGSAPKKNVITSKIKGKVYFNAWSMDVKFEGENVVRNLDLTTHNHASQTGATPPWPYMAASALDDSNNACNKSGDAKKVTDGCPPPAKPEDNYSKKCCDARKCMLVPYSPNKCCSKGGTQMTPHHIVPKSQFHERGNPEAAITLASGGTYIPDKAPCVCEDGISHSTGTHGQIHTLTNNATVNHIPRSDVSDSGKSIKPSARWKVSESEAIGSQATADANECDKDCIEAQVRSGHKSMGIDATDDIRPTTAGAVTVPPAQTALGMDD